MLIFGDNDRDSYFDDISDLKEIETTTMMITMTMTTLIDYIANFGDVEDIMMMMMMMMMTMTKMMVAVIVMRLYYSENELYDIRRRIRTYSVAQHLATTPSLG